MCETAESTQSAKSVDSARNERPPLGEDCNGPFTQSVGVCVSAKSSMGIPMLNDSIHTER